MALRTFLDADDRAGFPDPPPSAERLLAWAEAVQGPCGPSLPNLDDNRDALDTTAELALAQAASGPPATPGEVERVSWLEDLPERLPRH